MKISKNQKIFEISSKKIEISKFSFFIDFFIENFFEHFLVSKHSFSTFSTKCFDLEKTYFLMDFLLCRCEIFPGIQKSYLENHTGKLKIRKIEKSLFFILNFRYRCLWSRGSDILCVAGGGRE